MDSRAHHNTHGKARSSILLALIAFVAIPLAACSTVKGAGEDLQSASDSVNDEIHDRN
jgi:predicted small secreted protein